MLVVIPSRSDLLDHEGMPNIACPAGIGMASEDIGRIQSTVRTAGTDKGRTEEVMERHNKEEWGDLLKGTINYFTKWKREKVTCSKMQRKAIQEDKHNEEIRTLGPKKRPRGRSRPMSRQV